MVQHINVEIIAQNNCFRVLTVMYHFHVTVPIDIDGYVVLKVSNDHFMAAIFF